MNTHQRRAAEAARRQLAADRALAEQARTKIAAGKQTSAGEVTRALEALHAAGELNGPLADIAAALVDLVTGRLMATLDIVETDPRVITGKLLVASDDPYSIGSVLFDTTGALLVDEVNVAALDEAAEPIVGLTLAGRINLTVDRHALVCLLDIRGAANLIVELYALAHRGGFMPALNAAVDQLTAALPAPPAEPSEGPSQ